MTLLLLNSPFHTHPILDALRVFAVVLLSGVILHVFTTAWWGKRSEEWLWSPAVVMLAVYIIYAQVDRIGGAFNFRLPIALAAAVLAAAASFRSHYKSHLPQTPEYGYPTDEEDRPKVRTR